MNNCVLITEIAKKVEERQAQSGRSEIKQCRSTDWEYVDLSNLIMLNE